MKIEIGESLLLSWLKHIKECQLVQTNWKASSKWEIKNIEVLEQLMNKSSSVFKSKHGYDLYKGTKGVNQLLVQAEIDVLGISFDKKEKHIYAIDNAFHESGLNYSGGRKKTVSNVIKKCFRMAMCIYGYFGDKNGTIIFTSPKITPAVFDDIKMCIPDIESVLIDLGLKYKIQIMANEDFRDNVLKPMITVIDDVADTSELFMRSLKLFNFSVMNKSKIKTGSTESTDKKSIKRDIETIEYSGIDGLDEMKIGIIVRTILRKMLENGKVPKKEINSMLDKKYSKDTFGIQFPLLQKASLAKGKNPKGYYAEALKIFNDEYFLCSEWYENRTNNDRPLLLKWISLHQ